jgi:hypothetical protein
MPMIQVVKPFTLQLDPKVTEMLDPTDREGKRMTTVTSPSEMRYFDIGIYEVDDYTANHWYVQVHLKGYQEPAKGPGTAEYQMAQMQKPKTEKDELTDPTQPMPPDARLPQPAPIPANVTRAEPIA